MIVAIAYYASSAAHRPRIDCGYCTASTNSSSTDTVGGLVCPTECPLPIAPKWPPVLQLPPAPDDMDIGSSASTNLTGASIRRSKPPAATFLVTGTNQSFAESMHIFSFAVNVGVSYLQNAVIGLEFHDFWFLQVS